MLKLLFSSYFPTKLTAYGKTQVDGLPLPQRYGAILTIVIGISMAVLDGAIANIALPTIATDLQASAASFGWIINQSCHFCQS